MSSRSIRTMSRMDRRESIAGHSGTRAKRVGPESITTKRAVLKQRCVTSRVVDMDSGLAASRRPGMTEKSAQPDLLERLADPGASILIWLEPAALHERIGVLVP